MSERSAVSTGLFDPRTASYGAFRERLAAVSFVGTATGATAAFGTYVYHAPSLRFGVLIDPVLVGIVGLSGLLVKLLVGQMRASVTALLVAFATATAGTMLFQVAPYLLLGIPLGGPVLYIPLRDGFTLVIFFQAPLQFLGFLAGSVYEGFSP